MTTDFSNLPLLLPEMLGNLESLGYREMTPIQAASLPPLLQGSDLIVQAKTGSGKTAVFGIGLLNKLNVAKFRIQALVLCPTRELADQVGKEVRRLARCIPNVKLISLCGGKPFGPQVGSLEHGAHIVVGTPGRILKHLQKGTLNLHQVETLVLDEADRMLDMGFYDDIAAVIAHTPKRRQTLLFSATYPDSIKEMSSQLQRDPVTVTVDVTHSDTHIKQHFYEVEKGQRVKTMAALLALHKPESTVVFCNTRQQCQEVVEKLQQCGFEALALHGNLDQKERDQVLVIFANKSCPILVATDVAARGLDIKDLQAVINFELSRDPEVHVHRIGRTGRAGKKGVAISLYIASEAYRINALEEYLERSIKIEILNDTEIEDGPKLQSPMVTFCIDGGRKDKVRPGDILGALTGDGGIPGDKVGKIDIFDHTAYVAIDRSIRKKALKQLSEGRIKGRRFKVRRLILSVLCLTTLP
ncbi:ATP-dependent 23S rRNA helicase DbpA [hydrothermal vent metagenome]|uniref:ATP-dependent 23S rRNA helicase DbpA n=1 Tax=hydrothermal vent metagenome TaxID=652676 RepID=A0A3B1BHX4_9ZZZZ